VVQVEELRIFSNLWVALIC